MESSPTAQEQLLATLHEVSIRLPESTVLMLARQHPSIMSVLASAGKDENWWFKRVEFLVGRQLDISAYRREKGDSWARVYRSLEERGVRFTRGQDYGSLLLVQVLLNVGANPRDWGLLMYDVIRAGNPSVLRLLLSDERVALMLDGVLDEAIRLEKKELITILLGDKNIDPSSDSNYAFIQAVQIGDMDVVQMLLADKRVDPSSRHNAAVVACCQRGYVDILRLLISDKRVMDEYSLDEYSNDDLYLETSAEFSHTEVIQLLMNTFRPSLDAVERVLNIASRRSRLDTCVALMLHLVDEGRPIPEEAIQAARTRRRTDLLSLFEQTRSLDH